MNALDILLVVLLLAYALSGYWQGFITGAFATAGLLVGGLFGIWLAPTLLGNAKSSVWVSLGALFIVLLGASFGQALMQFVGSRLRAKVTWQPVRALDAVGGAALSVVAVLVVAWALGVAVQGANLPWVNEKVRDSRVLGRVNEVMPTRAVTALNSFNEVVGSSVFPRYLEPFAPEQIVEVGPPPAKIASDPQVRQAARSVVKIHGESSCGGGVEGTGFLYSPDRVMTNAHVVAGVTTPRLVTEDGDLDTSVVYYNPAIDVAVLQVEGAGLPHLAFDRDGGAGDPAAVLGYPNDGPYDVQGARIRAQQRLKSQDIYGEGEVFRDVYSVRSNIRPGNSGGPMVSPEGDVLGVVFAASVADPSTGYVLTADQVGEAAAQGLTNDSPVSSGRCT
jgi:S1-C subfamily serine protease